MLLIYDCIVYNKFLYCISGTSLRIVFGITHPLAELHLCLLGAAIVVELAGKVGHQGAVLQLQVGLIVRLMQAIMIKGGTYDKFHEGLVKQNI